MRVKTLDQTDSKVDWVIGTNDRLTGRYSFQKAVVTDPGLYGAGGIYGGPRDGGFGGQGPARTQSPGINYSKVFSPTFVWESRFGVVRNRNDALSSDYGMKTSEEIGIKGVNLDDWTSGLTEVRINGYTDARRGLFAEPAVGAKRDHVRHREQLLEDVHQTHHPFRYRNSPRAERPAADTNVQSARTIRL